DGIRDKLVTGVQTCALPIYEDGQGAQRFSDAGERLVLIDASPSGRRRLRRREPRLEVRVAHLQPLLGAMRLGVEAADELAAMEDRQRVVAVHALRARGVDLDAVVESEQARHSRSEERRVGKEWRSR